MEEIGALLVHGCEIRVNDAVGIGPLLGPEAAGDFLFDLGHAHGLLGQVVGERNAGIRGKAPDIVGVGAQAQEEVRRLALPGTPAFARGWSPGIEGFPFTENVGVAGQEERPAGFRQRRAGLTDLMLSTYQFQRCLR